MQVLIKYQEELENGEKKLDKKMHFFKNLSIENYVWLMKKVSCLVGNSSSGIREGHL